MADHIEGMAFEFDFKVNIAQVTAEVNTGELSDEAKKKTDEALTVCKKMARK